MRYIIQMADPRLPERLNLLLSINNNDCDARLSSSDLNSAFTVFESQSAPSLSMPSQEKMNRSISSALSCEISDALT